MTETHPSSPHRHPSLLGLTIGWGVRVTGAAALGLGLLGLIRGAFTIVWHPVPDWLPAQQLFAYLAAALFVSAAVGLQFRRSTRLAALVLSGLYLLLSVQWLIRVTSMPGIIGTWLGFAEQIALALGAAAILLATQRTDAKRSAVSGSVVMAFGFCQIVFGLGHILSLAETTAMTPTWLPGGPAFWAIATGVGHFAGGVALLAGWRVFEMTRLLAAMFFAFAALVWAPLLLANLAEPVPPAGTLITLALLGAVLSLGDLVANEPRQTRHS